MKIETVEISTEWGAPLLKVTDNTLCIRWYYLRLNGDLIQGVPHMLLDRGYSVSLLICGDLPILLDVRKQLTP